jgi:uncharacterized protein (DUF305 family)
MPQEVAVLNRRKRREAAPVRPFVVAAATVFAVLALGGCDSGSGSDDAETSGASRAKPGPSVILPGKPGKAAKTLSAEEASKAAKDQDVPNAADFGYVQKMIVHHQQALTMTKLVPQRAASGTVKRLAERISAAQRPEIESMESWLETNGGEQAHGDHGQGHASMPGMASEKQLQGLRAAEGEEFDRLFLKLMIAHHEGAITMAGDVLTEGNNVMVEQMANDVAAQQSAEIERMRKMS